MVVLSYPGPDLSVRLEALRAGRAGARRYRNRRIGEFLKELRLTEGRATGVPKIIRAMRDNGSPPPEFDFDENLSDFMARLPFHPAALQGAYHASLRPQIHSRATVESAVKSEMAGKILAFLQDSALSKMEFRKNDAFQSHTGGVCRGDALCCVRKCPCAVPAYKANRVPLPDKPLSLCRKCEKRHARTPGRGPM